MTDLVARRSLIIYFHGKRVIKNFHHYGSVRYVSKRLHYAIIYVDQEKYAEAKDQIKGLKAVNKVIDSVLPDLDPTLTTLEQTGLYKQHDEDDKE
ncbi:YlbG family protein [Lactobacillaceae bacterium 24-114]